MKRVRIAVRFLLVALFMLAMMLGMSMTALAYDGNPYTDLMNTKTTVKFNGYDWYIIEDHSAAKDAGTLTLLAKDSIEYSRFNKEYTDGNKYSTSVVKRYLDELTTGDGSFARVADAIETIPSLTTNGYNSSDTYDTVKNVKLYLLSTEEADALDEEIRKCNPYGGDAYNNYWWLRSPSANDDLAMCVNGNRSNIYGYVVDCARGVRPALRLDLSKVVYFSKEFALKRDYGKPCYLGSEVLKDGYNTWRAATVMFNGYEWRVIAYKNTNLFETWSFDENYEPALSGDTMTLFASNCLAEVKFDDDDIDGQESNVYASSTLKKKIDEIAEAFSEAEKEAISTRILYHGNYDGEYTNCIAGDNDIPDVLLWPLSAYELGSVELDYYEEEPDWWLRSPGGSQLSAVSARLIRLGNVTGRHVAVEKGVRPALNMKPENVILTSETSPGNNNYKKYKRYKLTMLDDKMEISADTDSISGNGATVTVPCGFSGSNAEKINRVYLLITNKDDTYGSEGWNSNATMQYMTYDVPDKDTVTFVLPENYEVNKDNWKVWILAAQENGETKSDYASAPVEITIPDLDEAEDHPQVGRTKAPNSLKIKGRTATVRYSKLKKKNQTLAVSKVIKFTNKGQGTMKYTLTSAKKGKENFKKYFKVNKTSGKLTVKKGLKKGTYKVKIKVNAAGNKNYKAVTKAVTVTVKVIK